MSTLSLRERAYRHIRHKLITGDVTSGQRLSELSLAREIGVSRTPVREAVSQLASEGLVERDPKLGVFVRTISRSELIDLLNLRVMLESYAVRRAARRISDAQLEELRKIVDRLRAIARRMRDGGLDQWEGPLGKELALTDMVFHRMIVDAAGSVWAARIIGDFHVFTTRYRHRSLFTLRNLATVLLEHWRIFRALQQRDPAAAAAAMRTQNSRARRKTVESYDRHELESARGGVRVTDWTQMLAQFTGRSDADTPDESEPTTRAPSARRRRR